MGVIDDVQALQATVVEKTSDIFTQLSTIVTNTISAAMSAEIPVDVDIPRESANEITAGEITFEDDEYVPTDLYTALMTLLVDEINNGGYGLDPNDEARLFERAREREEELADAAVDEATQLYAVGGFTMPPGSLQAALARVARDRLVKISSVNRDLLVKKADLYLTAKNHVLTVSGQLEDVLRRSFSEKQERRLKALIQNLMAQIEAAVANGNIGAAYYKAQVDAALGEAQLIVDAAKTRASILAQLASAGMSGLHVNASLAAGADAREAFNGGITEHTQWNHDYQEK